MILNKLFLFKDDPCRFRRISAVLYLFILSASSVAGEINLAWDRSPSSDVGGYRVYYGRSAGNYTNNIDAGNNTSSTVSSLADGVTYYFAAKAYNSARTAESPFSNEISATVPSAQSPVASFTASRLSGVAPLTVTYTDTSTGNITGRNWNLGNGATSTGVTPSTNYANPGTYTVTLTVTGSGGSDVAQKTISVTAPTTAPVAAFSAGQTSGTAPFTVNFIDGSTGATGWSWRFGDGGVSSAQNPSHTYSAPGSYTVALTVTGPGGSNTVTKTGFINAGSAIDNPAVSSDGLVAAYGFDDVYGTTVPDASGRGNQGVSSGVTSAGSGRFGEALAFNGSSSWVTVEDSPSLDFSRRMTLEAWVYPRTWMNRGATVLVKEDGAATSAYYLYANEDRNQPIAGARIGGYQIVSGTTQIPPDKWSHLAGTYDGQYLRLYVNGVEVDAQPQTGTIPVSSGRLRLGGNAIWGEYFNGYLDDVRIYNRALSPSQIVADSKMPVVNIVYSTAADRSNARPLNQATVTGNLYIHSTPDTGVAVAKVDFWVDSDKPASPAGAPDRSETTPPFDLAGGSTATANPSRFTPGTHTVSARYTLSNGTVLPVVTSRFTAR